MLLHLLLVREKEKLYVTQIVKAHAQTKMTITLSCVKSDLKDGCVSGFCYDIKSCEALENSVEVIIHVLMHFYFSSRILRTSDTACRRQYSVKHIFLSL